MITNQDIQQAYTDCADAEMEVLRAEKDYRKAHARVLKARQSLISYKDRIRYIHEEITEPVQPLEDMPDSVLITT